jgi:hypothetical protein
MLSVEEVCKIMNKISMNETVKDYILKMLSTLKRLPVAHKLKI